MSQGARARAIATSFSDLAPAEYRADAVVCIDGDDGQLQELLIVEIQLAIDAQKRASWPLYVARARANPAHHG